MHTSFSQHHSRHWHWMPASGGSGNDWIYMHPHGNRACMTFKQMHGRPAPNPWRPYSGYVSYMCCPGLGDGDAPNAGDRCSHAAEHESLKLDCEGGVVKEIKFASYGLPDVRSLIPRLFRSLSFRLSSQRPHRPRPTALLIATCRGTAKTPARRTCT